MGCTILPLIIRALLGKPAARRDARYQILAAVAKRWDFRLYHRDATWFRDIEFTKVIRAFPGGGGYTAKRYNLYYLARGAANIIGDTAECGVATGITSFLICFAMQHQPNVHYAFDSFEGLPEPEAVDKTESNVRSLTKGDFAVSLERVRQNLHMFSNVQFYKGWIPDRFVEVMDRKFSFVHIDVDFYQSTLDSLSFFYPRLVSGGIMVCDDYGYLGTPGATQALEEFLLDKPEALIKLAAGHAFIIKSKDE